MSQMNLFEDAAGPKRDRERCVIISLQPEYYRALCEGRKKIEYRRGVFLRGPALAFVYCTVPVKEIGAYVALGQPQCGSPEDIARIKETESPGSYQMMMDWMRGFKEASATPIENVQQFPAISLAEIKGAFPKFQPPQRFAYLDTQPELWEYLKRRSGLAFS